MYNNQSQRQAIRNMMQQRRQSLTMEQQLTAEASITQKVLDLVQQTNAQTIALYHSFNGEISTYKLINHLVNEGKTVCLPRIHPFSRGHLLFFRYASDDELIRHPWGMLEPQLNINNLVLIDDLDLIFLPLVAFDQQKNRLGMGGGFYDRTLVNWQEKNFKPIGLSHACQEVEKLPIEAWDIPLADILVG